MKSDFDVIFITPFTNLIATITLENEIILYIRDVNNNLERMKN